MLPPDKSRIRLVGVPPRTSKPSMIFVAKAIPALRSTSPPLENSGNRSSTAFSQIAISPIAPSRLRSSGMRPMPDDTASATVRSPTPLPNRTRSPALRPIVPLKSWASTACPLPETPIMPSTSPALSLKSIAFSRSTPPERTVIPPASSTISPGVEASRTGRVTWRPTISSASSALLVSPTSRSATCLPPRNTTMRSAVAITSSSLWEMKISDRPCRAISFKVENSVSASSLVRTAVGSSSTRMRASL
ncbi:hypothetical protein D3C71_521410 [compost metagenome]